jgi:hypothetical protein
MRISHFIGRKTKMATMITEECITAVRASLMPEHGDSCSGVQYEFEGKMIDALE